MDHPLNSSTLLCVFPADHGEPAPGAGAAARAVQHVPAVPRECGAHHPAARQARAGVLPPHGHLQHGGRVQPPPRGPGQSHLPFLSYEMNNQV